MVTCLKDKDGFHFLADITAVDYSKFSKPTPARFAVIYIFRDENFKNLITLKAFINEEEGDLHIDSICDIFFSANWAEREVWDQYGIKFLNHPNLKRVLNHKEFEGHPLRKDYPITQGQLCTKLMI